MTFKNSLISFCFILAITVSVWSIYSTTQTKKSLPYNVENQPDAYMEMVTATIINKEGEPSLKIQSPKMIHYASNDKTFITKPLVTLYKPSASAWFISSDYAIAENGTEQITFSKNVVIHHPNDISNPSTTIKTASLNVFPNNQTAETKDPITITQPDISVSAIGMLADLNEGTVKLLSKAQGDYVPKS